MPASSSQHARRGLASPVPVLQADAGSLHIHQKVHLADWVRIHCGPSLLLATRIVSLLDSGPWTPGIESWKSKSSFEPERQFLAVYRMDLLCHLAGRPLPSLSDLAACSKRMFGIPKVTVTRSCREQTSRDVMSGR